MANFVLIFLNWQQKAHTLGKTLQQVWFWRTWSTWSLWMCGLGEQVWEWLGLESSPLRLRPLLHFQVHALAVPRCTLSTLHTLLMWPVGCSQPPAISTINLTSTVVRLLASLKADFFQLWSDKKWLFEPFRQWVSNDVIQEATQYIYCVTTSIC